MTRSEGRRTTGRPGLPFGRPRVVALTAAVIVLATALLASCHPLINPADPNSVTYMGRPILPPGQDDSGKPLLPEVVEWRSYVEHMPGQWTPLTIPTGGSFVEPRFDGGMPPKGGIVFAESVWDYPDAGASSLVVYLNANSFGNGPGDPPDTGVIPFMEIRDGGLEIRFELPADYGWFPNAGGPDGARYRIELLDPSGKVHSTREWAWLHGDVDGDGSVSAATDGNTGITPYDGTMVDPYDGGSVRADVNADGWIDVNDQSVVSDAEMAGASLTGVARP